MLNRRLLRVKVLQVLYSGTRDPRLEVPQREALLRKLIKDFDNAYLLSLLFLSKVGTFAIKDKEHRVSRFLKENKDAQVDLKLTENPIIKGLTASADFHSKIEAEKLNYLINEDDIQKIYHKLILKDRYKEYSANDGLTVKEENKFIVYFFNKVILKSGLYMACLEDNFINWYDDREQIFKLVNEQIRKFVPSSTDVYASFYSEAASTIKTFGNKLLLTTITKAEELQNFINPQLKNWDPDRVTIVDNLILKMALAELIYFENIPVKVSINEYIEISKKYSTPNSKDFINGVLDKLMKKLRDEGKINKSGRGLVEF